MMPQRLRLASVALTLAVVHAVSAAAGPALAETSREEARIRALELQVNALQQQVALLTAALQELEPPAAAAAEPGASPDRVAEVERRQELLAGELETLKLGSAAVRAEAGEHGFGPAASKVYRTDPGVSLGGYGEMVFESRDSTRDDGSRSGARDQLDFLRGIVYVGYKFDDRWLFNSEIEFEHASTGSGGEASVEFAYLDYLWRPQLGFRAGLLLVPMGFVNELHEPTVFLGVRRPDVERTLLPTTWRENGFGLFGEVGDWSYRTYLVNGLEAEGFSAGGLRGGRQKGAQAVAEDFAWVGRLDWVPTPGLLLGASAYLGDSGQGLADSEGRLGVSTRIFEGHAEWRWRGFQLRALGALADLGDVARLNALRGLSGASSVGERQEGGYLELAYDVLPRRPGRWSLTPYARWERFETQAEVPAGFAANPANDVESLTLGLALRPLDQVIFKLDFQDYDNEAGTAVDQLNVGIGYIF